MSVYHHISVFSLKLKGAIRSVKLSLTELRKRVTVYADSTFPLTILNGRIETFRQKTDIIRVWDCMANRLGVQRMKQAAGLWCCNDGSYMCDTTRNSWL